MEEKKLYESPQIELLEIEVEQGFAASHGGQGEGGQETYW